MTYDPIRYGDMTRYRDMFRGPGGPSRYDDMFDLGRRPEQQRPRSNSLLHLQQGGDPTRYSDGTLRPGTADVPGGGGGGAPSYFNALDGIKRHWEPWGHDPAPVPLSVPSLGTGRSAASDRYNAPVGSLADLMTPTYAPQAASSANWRDVSPSRAQPVVPGVVVMSKLPSNGRLGLAIKDLEVLGLTSPAASACGWRVGDRVLSVNTQRVTSQAEFGRALEAAMAAHRQYQRPLIFEVERAGGVAFGSPPPETYVRAPGRRAACPCMGDED